MKKPFPYLAPLCEEVILATGAAILGASVFGDTGRAGNYDSSNDTDYGTF